MTIRVYNTLSNELEELVPLEPGKIRMYLCGPTVYSRAHVGNLRTFVSFDMIRRYLMYRGFDVTFVQNVTDIDDKMIQAAEAKGTTVTAIRDEFLPLFLADQEALGILPPTVMPLATEHIPEMIALIERLMERGLAYEAGGDVYFSVPDWPDYGRLIRQDPEQLQAGARVDVGEQKRHPHDFVLWKAQKPGEPAWDSPWGPGRPGWHIECSAMSMKYLGETFDIHAGAVDLRFPHHENELAQSCGATGGQFVRYWMHGGFLNFSSDKMSKSVGNVIYLDQIRERFEPEVLRFFFLQAHYRSPLEYSEELLAGAKSGLERLYNAATHLQHLAAHGDAGEPGPGEQALLARLPGYRTEFESHMDNDFNSGGAIGALFELARDANTVFAKGGSRAAAAAAGGLLQELGQALGLLMRLGQEDDLDAEIEQLIAQRQKAREARDWATADRIRDELTARGIVLEDTPQGVRWKRSG